MTRLEQLKARKAELEAMIAEIDQEIEQEEQEMPIWAKTFVKAVLDLYNEMGDVDDTELEDLVSDPQAALQSPQALYEAILAEDPIEDWMPEDLARFQQIFGMA